MFPIRIRLPLLVFALLSANIAFAQSQNAPGQVSLSSLQELRFISTMKASTFEMELNVWARQGFRFARLSRAFNNTGIGGLLAREKEGEGRKYEYKILATNKLSTMEKELEAAAAEGYEFRGVTTENIIMPFTLPETIVVLERPVGESKKRFDYKFVSTRREKTTQKELDAVVLEGYTPVEMILGADASALSVLFGPGAGIHITVALGRDAKDPGAEIGKREYRFLRTTKVATMEKEMNKLANEGFQFHRNSIGSITMMSRPLKEKTQKYEYKLQATQLSSTMQKELSEMGAQGWRFLGTSSGAGGMVSAMEREIGEGAGRFQYEYKFLETAVESAAEKELSEALASGYGVLEISPMGERLIVLGRRKEVAEAK